MNWYYYLNFRIYKFYEKKDNIPGFYSFLVTSTLMCLNVISIIAIIGFELASFRQFMKKQNALLLFIFMGGLNYFLLYKGNYYKDVFNEFDLHSSRYKNWTLGVKLYLIISICLLLSVLIIADLRNHGRL
jgi:hypothetical protein